MRSYRVCVVPSASLTTSLTTSFSLAPRPISSAVSAVAAWAFWMRLVRAAAVSWTGAAARVVPPDCSAGDWAEAPVVRPVVRRAPAATAVAMARVVRL